ncbi:MAG: hypothetical protein KA886_09575 [Candidatus Cloacimonetes bacterium]|nr:hypothetical protein [Candidatus Cloacimonadota bacterium]
MRTLKISYSIILILFVYGIHAKDFVFPKPSSNLISKDFFNQKNVKTPKNGEYLIEFQYQGKWKKSGLVEFPKEYMNWNISKRIKTLEQIENLMSGKSQEGPDLSGPHNGIVATKGSRRNDSQFDINNAVKGMGFLPRIEVIDSLNLFLKENMNKNQKEKLNILKSLYTDYEKLFDLRCQISLELYSDSSMITQTFLNQMTEPVCAIVFLDIPSYKIKAVSRILDPRNPQLTSFEKSIVEYTNLIHSFFHGQFKKEFIAIVYYNLEIYDNSPRGRKKDTGMGRLLIP